MVHEWVVERKGVILRGGELDEAAHGDTIEVQHTLRPLIVVMAGANEFDPYKD